MECKWCFRCERQATKALAELGHSWPTTLCKWHKKDVEDWFFDNYKTCYYCSRLVRDLWVHLLNPPGYRPQFHFQFEGEVEDEEDCE